jgi:hypothetical protein
VIVARSTRTRFPIQSNFALLKATVGFLAVLSTSLVAAPAFAGEIEDRAQLSVCVNAHLTTADGAVMRRVMFMLLADLLQPEAGPEAGLAGKRDEATGNAAALITRLAETDCKAEVSALMANKPAEGAFKTIFDAMNKTALAPLSAGLPRAGIALGLDIIKKLDPGTLADIQSTAQPSGATAGAPVKSNTRMTRSAASGVRFRLSFETSLNPDCSAMGKTTVRVLTKPLHGTATIDETKDFTSYEAANQRYHCNERKTAGTAIYYQSERGYTGSDVISYEIISPTGVRHQNDFDIAVK